MPKRPYTGPRIRRRGDLERFLRFVWKDPAKPRFLWIRKGKANRNIPVHSVDEAVAETRRWLDEVWEVYFAPSAFKSHDNRKAANIDSVPGFWFDIDVGPEKAAQGKGYATTEEAETTLNEFCDEAGIPRPNLIVRSGGGGFHVYWILNEPLDPETWKAYARKFGEMAQQWGLHVDPPRTADPASLFRVVETLNLKLPTPRPVTLAVATWKYFDNGHLLPAIEEAHARFCPAPVVAQPRAMVAMDRPHGPPDLDAIRTALAVLDPDCSEEDWKLRRIAPLARTARDHPELAEDLRALTMEWSSGVLRGEPSRKWREPGGNGLTGEQEFDRIWTRFLQEEDRVDVPTTLGTIFHAAQLAGAPLGALPDVILGDALSYLQMRFALIVLSGDLYVIDLEQE